MTLRLIASGNERALAIRDHVLPLLRRDGVLEVQRDTVRLIELRLDPSIFRAWTPFSALLPSGQRHPAIAMRSAAQARGRTCRMGWRSGRAKNCCVSNGRMAARSRSPILSADRGRKRSWHL